MCLGSKYCIMVKILQDSYGEDYVWLEDIINAVENVIPTLPYPFEQLADR